MKPKPHPFYYEPISRNSGLFLGMKLFFSLLANQMTWNCLQFVFYTTRNHQLCLKNWVQKHSGSCPNHMLHHHLSRIIRSIIDLLFLMTLQYISTVVVDIHDHLLNLVLLYIVWYKNIDNRIRFSHFLLTSLIMILPCTCFRQTETSWNYNSDQWDDFLFSRWGTRTSHLFPVMPSSLDFYCKNYFLWYYQQGFTQPIPSGDSMLEDVPRPSSEDSWSIAKTKAMAQFWWSMDHNQGNCGIQTHYEWILVQKRNATLHHK